MTKDSTTIWTGDIGAVHHRDCIFWTSDQPICSCGGIDKK